MVFYYWRQNNKADRGEVVLEGMENFRYTYESFVSSVLKAILRGGTPSF